MQGELKLEKFIVFRIAEYCLALSFDNVLRVIQYLPRQGEKLNALGLTQIGRHTIKILDIHQLLGGEPSSQASANPVFLVITHSSQGHLYGIPVYLPPDLIEIPSRLMNLLPPYDQSSHILSMASHTAVISQDEDETTVFLLDLKRVKDLYSSLK
jgi:chemotaxis signal transduction protein